MENLFLAFADKTRLRLLNLMRSGEVCVNLFSESLTLSQPKVSRHLAYLRNTGVVSTRRHGKWIYYGINSSISSRGNRVLIETLDWLASQPAMQIDYEKLVVLSRRQQKLQPDDQEQELTHEEIYPVYERSEEIETFLL